MNELQSRTLIIESTIKETPRNFVEKILKFNPKIVGLSVYIWNTNEILECVTILKKVASDVVIVLGGPEISYETETQRHTQWADYIIKGEADFLFYRLCRQILIDQSFPAEKIIAAELPDIHQIKLPYSYYTDEDIKNRVIYVEASRGCPYKCEYCLSSLDKSVRNFDLEHFLAEMKTLMDRGARTFKFVDRTFNLSPTSSTRILKFFLEHIHLNLFLHFEMVPDRLPVEIRDLIKLFPAGSLQFEVGIQTLNPEVAKNISRNNNLTKTEENFLFLRNETHVHTHADLIVGLPGETLESFAAGFDRLSQMGPDEIQVGILKRLKGTPIARHEKNFQMKYSEESPYQILSTTTMNYTTLQTMNRFAKFWDLYANSGEFKNFILWLKEAQNPTSFFQRFYNFSDYLSLNFGETHSISLVNLAEKAWSYLQLQGVSLEKASEIIENDYCLGAKRRDLPAFLKQKNPLIAASKKSLSLNSRQIKHLND